MGERRIVKVGERGVRRAAAGALAAVVLVGCGSTEEQGAASDEAVQDWVSGEAGGEFSTGPLVEYMGYDDPKAMAEVSRRQMKEQQQAIVECMREQGFEYVAFDPMGDFDPADFDPYDGLTREQYAKKWGYGISTTTSASGEPVDDAPGISFEPEEQPQDPNMKLRDALSAEEQAAYDQALYGNMMSETPAMEEEAVGGDAGSGGSDLDTGVDEAPAEDIDSDMPDFSQMGCQGAAMASDFGDLDEADMEAMNDAEEQLTQRVESDRRVKDAAKAYRTCMADAGFPDVTKPDQAAEQINERMSKLWEASTGGSDAVSSEFEDGEEFTGDVPTLDAEELKQLQQDEIALAVAELPCLAAYRVVQQEVRFEAEEAFIRDNPELLARLKKSLG